MTHHRDLSPRSLERQERLVLEGLVGSVPEAERAALGLTLADVAGGALLTLGRYPQVMDFNRTLSLGVERPATGADLDELQAAGRAHGLTRLMVGVVPGAQPGDLRGRLLERGAQPTRAWMQLWREAAPWSSPAPGLDLRKVGPEEPDTFLDVMARGFSLPPDLMVMGRGVLGRAGWTHYLAWDGSVPVASASLHLQGGYAWLGNATTLPDWRRRGAQLALVARRVTDAARAGAHTVFTQVAEDLPSTPNPSEHNMRRAGFQVAYRRDHLLLPTGLGD